MIQTVYFRLFLFANKLYTEAGEVTLTGYLVTSPKVLLKAKISVLGEVRVKFWFFPKS